MIRVRGCTVHEIFDSGLFGEYSHQSSIKGLPPTNPKLETYLGMEASGAFKCLGAFCDDLLIGFITVLTSVLPHYGAKVSVTESFFVSDQYRKKGAGIKLLNEAQRLAAGEGSYGLLVSAVAGSQLAKMLPLAGYTHTNQIYFRGLNV